MAAHRLIEVGLNARALVWIAPAAPNQRWVADFTYIPTGEGWLYLAVVLDLFSRRAVGWSMSPVMNVQFVPDALMMAM